MEPQRGIRRRPQCGEVAPAAGGPRAVHPASLSCCHLDVHGLPVTACSTTRSWYDDQHSLSSHYTVFSSPYAPIACSTLSAQPAFPCGTSENTDDALVYLTLHSST
jgi:hypothetical protein